MKSNQADFKDGQHNSSSEESDKKSEKSEGGLEELVDPRLINSAMTKNRDASADSHDASESN